MIREVQSGDDLEINVGGRKSTPDSQGQPWAKEPGGTMPTLLANRRVN